MTPSDTKQVCFLILTFIFFLFIFISTPVLTNAQTTATGTPCRITGKVIDLQENIPVEYANVILYHTGDTVSSGYSLTGSDGSFAILCKKPGNYYIEISFVGYETYRSALFAIESGKANLPLGNICFSPSTEQLSEVMIVGQKRQVVYKLDRQVIEAAGYLSAAGGTAIDILTQTPSMNVDAEGELTFRGSSGFRVYIDGKPSSLRGTAALEQIPAGQIENIEVLTTPSARNDADGSAGIININTRKQTFEGWSGIVNAMGSSELSRNIDFLLSLRKKNFRWQLSGEASRRYVLSDFDQEKTITTSDTLTTTHSKGDRERHTDIYYLRSAFDWFQGNTTWSAAFQGGYRDRWRGGDLHYDDSYQSLITNEKIEASFNGSDFVHLYEYNLRGDLGVEHHFPGRKGHTLQASLYGLYEGNAMEHFQTDLWDMQGKQFQGHRAYEYEYRFTGQVNADYVYPFANTAGKFEAGYQLFTYTEDGDYKVDMYDNTIEQFVRRNDLYNKYLFRRDIHALYAMLSNTHSSFSYQLGLRGEYTYRKLGNNEAWARHTRNRFDLFPSLHLAMELDDHSRIRLAYARRITQPQLFYMEPYVVYVDYYTAQRGNPFINPEYTNSIELGYNRNFGDNTLSANLFHRTRKDKIERLRTPYHTGVTLDSMTNVGDDYATGVELATAIRFTPWWNFDANGSFYYYKIKNDYKVSGKDEDSWNWQLAVNNNFDVTKTTRMRLEAYYVGPMVSTQGRVEEFFYFNFAVRQQLLKRKLTASLVVRDIFSTAKYVSTQSGPYMESRTKIYPSAPLFTLTLSYTFNNFRSQQKSEKVSHDIFEGTNR